MTLMRAGTFLMDSGDFDAVTTMVSSETVLSVD